MKDMEKFKKDNIVTIMYKSKTEDDYYKYRKNVFKNELMNYKEKELIKKD